MKDVNAFSGKKLRIYAHVKGRFKTDGGIFSVTEPPRLSSPTSRDVLFTTRRLVRTSPGVGKTNPGLVRTTPGLVEKAYHTFSHPKLQSLIFCFLSHGTSHI